MNKFSKDVQALNQKLLVLPQSTLKALKIDQNIIKNNILKNNNSIKILK